MVEEKEVEVSVDYIPLWFRFKIWFCDRIGAMSYYDYKLLEEDINTQLEAMKMFMGAQGKFDQWICKKFGIDMNEIDDYFKNKSSFIPLGDAGKESDERGVYQ